MNIIIREAKLAKDHQVRSMTPYRLVKSFIIRLKSSYLGAKLSNIEFAYLLVMTKIIFSLSDAVLPAAQDADRRGDARPLPHPHEGEALPQLRSRPRQGPRGAPQAHHLPPRGLRVPEGRQGQRGTWINEFGRCFTT